MSDRPITTDIAVAGMDCADCAAPIERAVRRLPGVQDVQVLVSAGRVSVTIEPGHVTSAHLRAAVGEAGFTVIEPTGHPEPEAARRGVGEILGWGALALVAVVVVLAALGEWVGVFDTVLDDVSISSR